MQEHYKQIWEHNKDPHCLLLQREAWWGESGCWDWESAAAWLHNQKHGLCCRLRGVRRYTLCFLCWFTALKWTLSVRPPCEMRISQKYHLDWGNNKCTFTQNVNINYYIKLYSPISIYLTQHSDILLFFFIQFMLTNYNQWQQWE